MRVSHSANIAEFYIEIYLTMDSSGWVPNNHMRAGTPEEAWWRCSFGSFVTTIARLSSFCVCNFRAALRRPTSHGCQWIRTTNSDASEITGPFWPYIREVPRTMNGLADPTITSSFSFRKGGSRALLTTCYPLLWILSLHLGFSLTDPLVIRWAPLEAKELVHDLK